MIRTQPLPLQDNQGLRVTIVTKNKTDKRDALNMAKALWGVHGNWRVLADDTSLMASSAPRPPLHATSAQALR